MVVFLYTVHPNTKDKCKRHFMWIYTKPLANSKVNRLLGLMMNLPSVSEWNGFLGCEAPKYENWVDISERTITIASLKKIKKLHTTHSFWNKNFHCHFPLTLQKPLWYCSWFSREVLPSHCQDDPYYFIQRLSWTNLIFVVFVKHIMIVIKTSSRSCSSRPHDAINYNFGKEHN